MKRDGAKVKMTRLQGRRENSCESCGDEVGLTTCGVCGAIICRDCKMDQEAHTPKGKSK